MYRPAWIIITGCKIWKTLLFSILSSTNNYHYKNVLLVFSNLLSIRKSYSQHYSYLRVVDICQYETVFITCFYGNEQTKRLLNANSEELANSLKYEDVTAKCRLALNFVNLHFFTIWKGLDSCASTVQWI